MRLIDADELKRKLKETAPGLKWIFNEIDNAPTIMPKKEKIINMREPTPEERESIDKYIKSISKPTGVNFGILEEDKE